MIVGCCDKARIIWRVVKNLFLWARGESPTERKEKQGTDKETVRGPRKGVGTKVLPEKTRIGTISRESQSTSIKESMKA